MGLALLGFPHSVVAPWARRDGPSLAQRNSRRIPAARPTAQRLHLACWNGALCGVWAGCDRLGMVGVWAECGRWNRPAAYAFSRRNAMTDYAAWRLIHPPRHTRFMRRMESATRLPSWRASCWARSVFGWWYCVDSKLKLRRMRRNLPCLCDKVG